MIMKIQSPDTFSQLFI